MTERLSETALNDKLERFGAMDRANQPGVYAIRLDDPADDANEVLRAWAENYAAEIPDGLGDRLATAERLLYVGAHGKSMYTRVCQHIKGHKSSTIMDIWPPVDLVGIWPHDNPDAAEFNRAVALSNKTTEVWMNGKLI